MKCLRVLSHTKKAGQPKISCFRKSVGERKNDDFWGEWLARCFKKKVTIYFLHIICIPIPSPNLIWIHISPKGSLNHVKSPSWPIFWNFQSSGYPQSSMTIDIIDLVLKAIGDSPWPTPHISSTAPHAPVGCLLAILWPHQHRHGQPHGAAQRRRSAQAPLQGRGARHEDVDEGPRGLDSMTVK